MEIKVYNKLVRDNIPAIIEKNGGQPKTRLLDNEEYYKELNIKLKEETTEYLESYNIEELADIEEVIRAILDFKGTSYEEFESLRLKKQEKRGAFRNRVFLGSVEEF